MAALTAARDTKQRGNGPTPAFYHLLVAANVKCIQGGIAVLDGGYVKPGVTGTGLIAVGRFEETVDNTGGAAGAKKVRVTSGCFRWGNSGSSDAIAQANVGAVCYVVDDQTVALTNGSSTRSIAGVIDSVDSSGVYVISGLPSHVVTATAPVVVSTVISIPVPALSAIANSGVIARITPAFAGRIIKTSFQATTPASTAARAATLTPNIAGSPVTGGVLALTTAGLDTLGDVVEGTSVTAANTFTAAQEITVVASSVTAFGEGAGVLFIHIA